MQPVCNGCDSAVCFGEFWFRIYLGSKKNESKFSKLVCKTENTGRWEASFFLFISLQYFCFYFRNDIGVFFCGPKPLSKILLKTCNQFSDPTVSTTPKTRFFYNEENFWFDFPKKKKIFEYANLWRLYWINRCLLYLAGSTFYSCFLKLMKNRINWFIFIYV